LEKSHTGFPFSLRGKQWPSLQHYIEAQKFHDSEFEERVRTATSPEESVLLAEEFKDKIRPKWKSIESLILFEGILARLDQHPELRELIVRAEFFGNDSEMAKLLFNAQSLFRRISPNESIIFDLYEDGDEKKTQTENCYRNC